MRKKIWAQACLLGIAMAVAALPGQARAADGEILRAVKARGYVTCGFRPSVGFAYSDDNGKLSGFLVDFCHAVAAATLGDAEAIRAEHVPDKPREFVAVENHEVDIAFHNTTWTLSRDVSYAIQFTTPVFYDGEGFAEWSDGNQAPLRELGEQTVCVKSSTTTQRNLEDFIQQAHRRWSIRLFKTYEEALQAFLGTECGMLTTDSSLLAMSLANYKGVGKNLRIFPEVISREPLTPYVPGGDDNWQEIVRAVIFATILAEERGVTSANAQAMREGRDEEVRQLLGGNADLGSALGLNSDWALQVIAQVGNYGEIFERHLGQGSPFKMQRGLNALWTKGGLMYSPSLE